MKKTPSGFTLIELIIVIIVLLIISAIGFNYISIYSSAARNTARITDVTNLRDCIESFAIKNLQYPEPENLKTVQFNDKIAWRQGEIGENIIKQFPDMDSLPKDPLLNENYEYSVSANTLEFDILYKLEPTGKIDFFQNNKTNGKNFTYKTEGTFNGAFLKMGSSLIALPSLIAKDLTANKKVWLFNYVSPMLDIKQIPDTQKITIFSNGASSVFAPIIVADKIPKDNAEKTAMIIKVKDVYGMLNYMTNIKNDSLRLLLNSDNSNDFDIELLNSILKNIR